MIIPLLFIGAGVTLFLLAFVKLRDEPPVHDPDEVYVPGKTGYKRVDVILEDLKKAAQSSGIPLGVLVGWIAKESGGKLEETTKYDERGYFQLMPDESKSIGVDHQRLSTDSVYSINAGLKLIAKYMGTVRAYGVTSEGSNYFWRLVKLAHSMGAGAVKKIIARAKEENATRSWDALEDFAIAHDKELLSLTKHSPAKWFPFVDKIAAVGAPFGFGSDATMVVGAVFDDIIDPLDCLQKR